MAILVIYSHIGDQAQYFLGLFLKMGRILATKKIKNSQIVMHWILF